MRILQINVVYREKSTGRNCAEVEKFLLAKEIDCYTAYGVGEKGKSEKAYRIETKLGYTVHNILSRLLGLEGYFSVFATYRLLRYIRKLNPDIIHLHNLHGHYLSLPLLFAYLKRTQLPLIINLHDCWIFTGKCVYPVRVPCEKWKTKCVDCPARREYPTSWFFDQSEKLFRDKKKWLTGLNVVSVVGVSDWVCGQAKQSYLSRYPINRIYNWVDFEVFKPYQNNTVFEEFGIPRNRFTIICVAAAWKEGSVKNEELSRLIGMMPADMQLVVIGKEAHTIKGDRVYPVGYITDTTKLAQLYSASDVYVHLSSADTFGKVIAEAMACGTPAVVYDCTACTELVKTGCGYTVPLHDVGALFAAVCEVRSRGKVAFADACVTRVRKEFDYASNCDALLRLYREGMNDSEYLKG
ncbi:MAG: glycosyltransferase [Oscillospiraceae bacterium]|nr:glycosyltransferase [Oscillospiraceae bacterium]